MGAREFNLPTDAYALIASVWREYLAPPRRVTVTEWAEDNRVLSGKDSAEPGPYRVHRTPYAREPQDCLSAHSPVEEVVLIWGAQTSKTTILLNWVGYTADVNPGPMMVTQPTIDMGKRFSRQRVAPLIEESKALRSKVSEARSRDEANTTMLKEFAGGFLAIAGANSAAGLRSMPVRDLAMDEIDGYPLDVDGEGDPCQLAEARQTTFARRKRLKTSTPTFKGLSRIEAAYQASDRCRYEVPCPHCGELQALEWGADKPWGIKFSKGADGALLADSVRYVCRFNGCEIREHHKPGMLAGGRWVAQAPGAAGGRVRGFQLSSLYSPLGWLSWREIAEEWLAAITAQRAGDSSLLRVFVNTRLAETFDDDGQRADGSELEKRAENYRLGTVPWGGLVVTGASDVQADRIECYAKAWGRGEESWLVDARIFYGDPSVAEGQPGSPWNEVTAWRRQPFAHASGVTMRMRAHGIDTGYLTQDVYAYVRRHAHEKVLALDGRDKRAKAILGKPVDVEINHRGLRLRKGVKLWPVGTYPAKALIYGRLRVTTPGPGYMHFSTDLLGSYYEQLTAERLVTKYVRGHAVHEWVKPNGKRNEALDCEVYSVAVAHFLGIPRFVDQQWAALEARLRQAGLFDAGAEEPALPPAADERPEEGEAPAPEAPSPAPSPLPVEPPKVTLAPEVRVSDSAPPASPPAPTPAPSLSQPAAVRRPVVRGRIQRRTRW